ncbi:hypothetical protein [Streptomyces parvulus]|nr:hypothetical protein [Streptomyces parvulus]GGR79370.1 hypothetical protein GCM10010220_34620 [Streptomyces parvulus]
MGLDRGRRVVLQRFPPHMLQSLAGRGRMLRWKTLVVAGFAVLRRWDD